MTDPGKKEGYKRVRHKTLSAYYSNISTLSSSLSTIFQSNNKQYGHILKSTDPPKYKVLLDTTLVALKSDQDEQCLVRRLARSERDHHGVLGAQQESIDWILRELSKKSDKNVLLVNNRFPIVDLPINISRPNVENRHVHSPSSVLRDTEWRLLRSRIGEEAFRLLIVHTSIFLPIGNNCFSQLSGMPIYDLYDHGTISQCKLPQISNSGICSTGKDNAESKKRNKKRKKAPSREREGKQVKRTKSSNSIAEVKIPRQRIYYGHPSRSSNGKITYGLPNSHILHKLAGTLGGPTDLEYLNFVQAVFPSLFQGRGEDGLKIRGNQERLEGILGMVRELVARYKKINFKRLLKNCMTEHVCTFKTCHSGFPITQVIPSSDTSGQDDKVPLESRYDDPLPPVLGVIPHRQVCRFLTSTIRALFSIDIIGSQDNLDTLLSHMRRFVKAKQYEPVNLHKLLQGISINDLGWLIVDSNTPQRVNISEATKRTSLVEDFIQWIFEGLIIPLLRNTFYITETASTRYETVYYSHEEWQKATKPHLKVLKDELLTELDRNESFFAQQGPLGVSAVRLIPKPKGFRPIVNLGRKIKSSKLLGIPTTGYNKRELTANQILRGVHQVLTFEKDRHRCSLGASLFGTNEIFAPIRDLKVELFSKNGKIPKLHFVKMDIKAAFDTIKQDKMIQIVSSLLDKNNDYCLMLYCLLLPPASKASQGASRRLFKARAVVDDQLANSFSEHARDIAAPLRNAVLVDLVRRKRITKTSCLELLKTHIEQNVWQVGKRFYRQKVGIPQGSKISSLLCSFFYASMENEYLSFTRRKGSRLLRYIDDFLFITDSINHARRFVDTMSKGFPTYGAEISLGKTLLSFECESKGQMGSVVDITKNGEILFPYCGFLIDTSTLEVMGDHPRLMANPIRQSFALRSDRHRGSAFVGWFSRQLENRNQVAYLDTAHNKIDTVHYNVFISFALTSMKIPFYFKLDDIQKRRETSISDALLLSVGYTYLAGRARVKHSNRNDEEDDHYDIRKTDFTFLAINAIIRVLRKKPRFKGITKLLEMHLKERKYRKLSERLEQTIEKGWGAVKGARY
ncbi:uncharacterized protein IL334_006576 [Kwoniella shivajii]|uniref:Telomerase reverse transcriptase n=1 Tax=Kwoniella shivajii TaxID=564305 RepID=A0ABZ1D7J7_9TREE|nr:hypothetical protein IL334_006576 [Kwoniella shivajii]